MWAQKYSILCDVTMIHLYFYTKIVYKNTETQIC